MSRPATPYYLLDERKLLKNLKRIRQVGDRSGAKIVLATKCFSSWAVFGLMREYLDGTTSSSLYEARLGYERFGGETHAYCVAFNRDEVRGVAAFADKVIFNSVSQLDRFATEVRGKDVGLRINPGFSFSHFDLADPARPQTRLGVTDRDELRRVLPRIRGAMFHLNCENDDFPAFEAQLERLGREYWDVLAHLDWVSLGGGLYFTKDGYPRDLFARALKGFAHAHGVQVYLEPGEAAITQAGQLVTTVLDVVHNGVDIAIVDASTEAHMLDLLIYRTPARVAEPATGGYPHVIAGRSCLAGDVFGTFRFPRPLRVGSIVRIGDAAGYSIVKKNWFNGLAMPSIVVRRLDGRVETVRGFGYEDFVGSVS